MPKEEAELFLEGIHQERHALRRMLKYDDELGLVGMVIYLERVYRRRASRIYSLGGCTCIQGKRDRCRLIGTSAQKPD